MLPLIYALCAAFIVSLISLIGLITLPLKAKSLDKILIYLVSFAAGGLMGGAFFHLFPEVIELNENVTATFVYVALGFCLFFILEKYLRWHHCHNGECESHAHLGYLSLSGDFFHNMLDGVIIVSSFMISTDLGLVVTLSIMFHEIPQELGDYGVLLYSGFTKSKALLLNFLTGLSALLGVVLGYLLINWVASLNLILISIAAGGFIYVAAADFIPELHKENKTATSIITFMVFLLALIFMLTIKFLGVE
jgi:zinc and cadmium transporter